jgi:hypothetical protein
MIGTITISGRDGITLIVMMMMSFVCTCFVVVVAMIVDL